jgi:hypothetical protein
MQLPLLLKLPVATPSAPTAIPFAAPLSAPVASDPLAVASVSTTSPQLTSFTPSPVLSLSSAGPPPYSQFSTPNPLQLLPNQPTFPLPSLPLLRVPTAASPQLLQSTQPISASQTLVSQHSVVSSVAQSNSQLQGRVVSEFNSQMDSSIPASIFANPIQTNLHSQNTRKPATQSNLAAFSIPNTVLSSSLLL